MFNRAATLLKMPVGGGPETKVLDKVYGRNFVPGSDGIYFMVVEEGVLSLRFLDFLTGSVRPIRSISRRSHNIISLSADGRWLAYDQAGSDIVTVGSMPCSGGPLPLLTENVLSRLCRYHGSGGACRTTLGLIGFGFVSTYLRKKASTS